MLALLLNVWMDGKELHLMFPTTSGLFWWRFAEVAVAKNSIIFIDLRFCRGLEHGMLIGLELLPHITYLRKSIMFVGTWFGYWTVERVCDCNIDLWKEQLETKMGMWVMMHGFQQFNHETRRFQSRASSTKFFEAFRPWIAQALAGDPKYQSSRWASDRLREGACPRTKNSRTHCLFAC
jgi:hypothetical protein